MDLCAWRPGFADASAVAGRLQRQAEAWPCYADAQYADSHLSGSWPVKPLSATSREVSDVMVCMQAWQAAQRIQHQMASKACPERFAEQG